MDNKNFSSNKKIDNVFNACPPTDAGQFPFKYRIYIFQEEAVYDLFKMDDKFVELMHSTRMEVKSLMAIGCFSKEEVVLYYPELWLPPMMQAEWNKKILNGLNRNTKSVRVITNSPLLCQGLNRAQIIIVTNADS